MARRKRKPQAPEIGATIEDVIREEGAAEPRIVAVEVKLRTIAAGQLRDRGAVLKGEDLSPALLAQVAADKEGRIFSVKYDTAHGGAT